MLKSYLLLCLVPNGTDQSSVRELKVIHEIWSFQNCIFLLCSQYSGYDQKRRRGRKPHTLQKHL